MIDPIQIIESRALGADCILLIMASLSDAQANELEAVAISHGMDVLVEIHDEAELERAMLLSSPLMGINNRNLKTMDISLDVGLSMLPKLPKTKTPSPLLEYILDSLSMKAIHSFIYM